LREESAKELTELKTTSKEMLERENKALRESREDAIAHADRARLQLQVLRRVVISLPCRQRRPNPVRCSDRI
jgi:hypothetical protein